MPRWISSSLAVIVLLAAPSSHGSDLEKQPTSVTGVGGQLYPFSMQRITKSDAFFEKESFFLAGFFFNGLPLGLTDDGSGGAWVVTEFGNILAHVDAAGSVNTFLIPLKSAPRMPAYSGKPFVKLNGDRVIRGNSESIVRDSAGRLWFPENGSVLGWLLPPITPGSYSRIVGFDPDGNRFCAIPVPDNGANLVGVAWDEARGRVWFLQSGNNGLVWFDPDEFDFENDCPAINDYEWGVFPTGSLLNPVPIGYCSTPEQVKCFHKTILPTDPFEILTADLLAVQQSGEDAGAIWLTRYWAGATLSRFDPETGVLTHFPIHTGHALDPAGAFGLATLKLPWNVEIHPDGDLLFPSQGLGQLIRFDIQRFLDPGYTGECEQLTASGRNPCMTAFEFPDLGEALLHSGKLDSYGNYWFTTWAARFACPPDPPGAGPSPRPSPPSIGFINRDWTDMVYFDHLRLEPEPAPEVLGPNEAPRLICDYSNPAFPAPFWGFTGLSILEDNTVWLANFWQQYVHRLSFIPGSGDPYCAIRGCPPE